MKKYLLIPIILAAFVFIFFLYKDARTLEVSNSDLPIDDSLAERIALRYLAGWWTIPSKLHYTPHGGKNVTETDETFVVNTIDEREPSFCKGYQVIIDKNTGSVKSNEEISYCD